MILSRLALVCSFSIVGLGLGCVGTVSPGTGTPDPGTPPPSGGPGSGSDPGPGSGTGIGSGSGSGTTPLTATTYIQQLATKQCDEAFACQASYPLMELQSFSDAYGATPQACYPLVTATFAPSAVEAEITAGKVTFDPTAAASCLASITFGTCDQFWATGGLTLRTCAQVFHGSVSEGDPCVIDLDCVDQDAICEPTIQICLPSGIAGD